MRRVWRQNKERNQRVLQAREQLAIVHESILAVHEALKTVDENTPDDEVLPGRRSWFFGRPLSG
jgi:hypothetical protein